MRYLFFFGALILIPFLGVAQAGKKWRSINMGFLQTNSAGLVDCFRFDEGEYPLQQAKATFFDLNFLVTQRGNGTLGVHGKALDLSKFALTYGFGINNKGFQQKGMASDGTSNYYEYNALVKRHYFSFYGGLSYDMIRYKKLRAGLGLLLNPDIDLGKVIADQSGFKVFALGSRSLAFLEYDFTDKAGLRISPYYQYAVTNYFQHSKTTFSNYRPNGFGFNVGLLF
jgi:hypothetical protein